jgi:4-amino-4-deoxy-L-arabinose transferase-like glycosyltransferase
MSDSEKKSDVESPDQAEWVQWWSTKTGTIVAACILAVISGVLLFGNLSGLGIWEPWEAAEILVAHEYAERMRPGGEDPEAEGAERAEAEDVEGRPKLKVKEQGDRQIEPNWAVPMLDGEPVNRSLLKTWLISAFLGETTDPAEMSVGALEWRVRAPSAVFVLMMVLLVFIWLRSFFDTWTALLTSTIVVTTPAFFLGAHVLSSEMLYVVTTSVAILAYFETIYATSNARWVWGTLMGLGLAFAFFDQRFFGLLTPLSVIVCFGLTQLPFEEMVRLRRSPDQDRMIGRTETIAGAVGLLAAVGVIVWAFIASAEVGGDDLFEPHVSHVVALAIPSILVVTGGFFARRTSAIKALKSGPGLLALGMAGIAVFSLVSAYGDALPAMVENGQRTGVTPVLAYLLENDLTRESIVNTHPHFAMWLRQLGFSLVPWVALVPLGFGYLARAARVYENDPKEDEDRELREGLIGPAESLKRMLLVWGLVALVVTALASAFDHYFFPGYFPLLAGVGLMLADRAFWREARLRSVLGYAMGFVAIAVIMMLGKDLERFPARLLESYLKFQEDLGLPEDFTYGRTLKTLKYGWMALLATYFFGLVSWAILTLRNVRSWPQTFKEWREKRAEDSEDAEPEPDTDEVSPLRQRVLAKEEFRAESGLLASAARIVELPGTGAALMALAGVVTAGVMLFAMVPELSNHLSQRGIFETYTKYAADDEELFRYHVSLDEQSVYLRDVERISNSRDFLEKFDQDERFFAVVPRKRLANINYDVRRRFERNVPVLNASSSRLLLISNKYEEGEPRENFVADQIMEEGFVPEYPLWFSENGRMQRAEFDKKLQLVGYDIDQKEEDGSFPEYRWGDEVTLTLYFRVDRRVTSQEKIFLHVDYPGNRIHGDHDPAGGEFPTNYWLPGDIVKDEYTFTIDNYSPPGVYSIYFGFYRGGRMNVTPAQAHDGSNRVLVGKIRVKGVL